MTEFIIYVSDQYESAAFYSKVLQKEPVLNVPGMTEFLLEENCKLGIMPEKNIAKMITPVAKDPSLYKGISRCELYLYVSDPEEYLSRAVDAGAKLISPCEKRNWGDTAGYCMDADGHVLAFALQINNSVNVNFR